MSTIKTNQLQATTYIKTNQLLNRRYAIEHKKGVQDLHDLNVSQLLVDLAPPPTPP